MTSGPDILLRLAITPPPVEINSGRCMARLLYGITRDLSLATRSALEGGPIAPLIDQLDRAEPWPPMASAVQLAAEIAAHLVDQRTVEIPTRTKPDESP